MVRKEEGKLMQQKSSGAGGEPGWAGAPLERGGRRGRWGASPAGRLGDGPAGRSGCELAPLR